MQYSVISENNGCCNIQSLLMLLMVMMTAKSSCNNSRVPAFSYKYPKSLEHI